MLIKTEQFGKGEMIMSEEIMKKMLERLEIAREISEDCDVAIYAFGNGDRIKIVPKFSWFDKVRDSLEKDGYWIVSIFENGHRVEF